MFSSTNGTWAVCNWRYEASKEETVAKMEENRVWVRWVFMGFANSSFFFFCVSMKLGFVGVINGFCGEEKLV